MTIRRFSRVCGHRRQRPSNLRVLHRRNGATRVSNQEVCLGHRHQESFPCDYPNPRMHDYGLCVQSSVGGGAPFSRATADWSSRGYARIPGARGYRHFVRLRRDQGFAEVYRAQLVSGAREFSHEEPGCPAAIHKPIGDFNGRTSAVFPARIRSPQSSWR